MFYPMWRKLLQPFFRLVTTGRKRRGARRGAPRWLSGTFLPRLEILEDRLTPSTYTVSTTAGGGLGSLSWAVTQANSDASGTALINFAEGAGQAFAGPTTITLTSGLTLNNSHNEPITITGPAAALTIKGGGFSVFTLVPGRTATISHLTISGAHTSNGGAITNNGTLTLSYVNLTNNAATANGGAVYNLSGSLTIDHSTFTSNTAGAAGGAIFSHAGLSVGTSTFTSNSAAAKKGGAVYSEGLAAITTSTLSSNTAAAGGGVYNHGTMTISGSTFASNNATGDISTDSGGAVYNDGKLSLINATLANNSADIAGAGVCDQGTLTVVDSTITNNGAQFGGGIFEHATVTLANTIVAGNIGFGADVWGGASGSYNLIGSSEDLTGIQDQLGDAAHHNILLDGENSFLEDLGLPDLTAGLLPLGNYGGPTQTVALAPNSAALRHGAVVSGINTDQRGLPRRASQPDIGAFEGVGFQVTTISPSPGTSGSLPWAVAQANNDTNGENVVIGFALSPANITVQGTLGLNNSRHGESITITAPSSGVSVSGGGSGSNFSVFSVASGTTATIDGLTIANGHTNTNGGAINNSGTLTLSNSTVTGNASAHLGGGVYNSGSLTLTADTFSGNTGGDGGAVYNESTGNVTVLGGTFSGNSADDGGAIENVGTLQATGVAFRSNTSTSSVTGGGAIYSVGAATFVSATFTGNSAAYDGGAIFASGTLTVAGSTFSNNSGLGGGGIALPLGSGTVTGSTFAGNTAQFGGALYGAIGTLTVTNSTLSGNSASSAGGAIENLGTLNLSQVTVTGNSSPGGFAGGMANFGTATLMDTLVAGNTAGFDPDIYGAVSGSFNLVGNGSGVSGIVNGQNGNIFGAALTSALGNYGGTTQTVALLPGSRAIGAGGAVTSVVSDDGNTITVANGAAIGVTNPVASIGYVIAIDNELLLVTGISGNVLTVTRGFGKTTSAHHSGGAGVFLAVDERGIARPASGADNIGAFQSQGFKLTASATSTPQTTDVGRTFGHSLAVTVTANAPQEPVAGGAITFTAPSSGPTVNLPGGASVDISGRATVNGPAAGGAGSYTVTASAAGVAAPVTFDLTNTKPTLGALSTPEVTVGQSVNVTIPINGGIAPYALVTAPVLPSGLSAAINGSSIVISGTAPSTPQTINFNLAIRDNLSVTASPGTEYTLVVDPAHTFTVVNTSDDGLAGSLRWAVQQADGDTSGGAVTINFLASAFGTAKTITLTSGLTLNNTTAGESIVLVGPVAHLTVQGGGSSSNFSAFTVTASTTATLENLTVTSSHSNGDGAAINNAGSLSLLNFTATGNSAANGGAIASSGTLMVMTGTFSSNAATTDGGGINNTGTATVANVTFSGNTAIDGAAVNNTGTLTVTSSTLANNTATGNGGGINSTGTLTLSADTLYGNAAATGLDLNGSATGNDDLIGSAASLTGNNNLIGQAALVSALGSYGGQSKTIALLPGSPAIAAGGSITTLAADVTSATATTITVASGAAIAVSNPVVGTGFYIWVDGEQMVVTGISGNTLTVRRGYLSTAATHSSGAGIYFARDERAVPRPDGVAPDIGAFQSRGFTLTVNSAATPQITPLGAAFSTPLGVTVTAVVTIEPVAGGVVTYTVPGSGASAVLSSATATINGSGQAGVTATSNAIPGTYSVSVSAAGVAAPGTFTLTNKPPDPTLGALSMPEVQAGQSYSASIPVNNGTPPFTIQSVAGLPAGLTASVSGASVVVSGTAPSTPQTINFSVTIIDSASVTATQAFSLVVTPVGTFAVVNTSSSAAVPGSLPWAVAQADADASGGAVTIVFDADAGMPFATPQTIALADTLHLNNSTPGESIVISGPTADLTIQGGGSMSNFSAIGVATNTTATITNLIITNGYSANGGAIENDGTLTAFGVTLSSNTASNEGGAIENNGTLTLTNATLSANAATAAGGAISNNGTLTVTSTGFVANTAPGGGAVNNAGQLWVTGSHFSSNIAVSGGAIDNAGTLSIAATTFSSNSASNGGAIDNEAPGLLTAAGVTFSANSASDVGGAIDNAGTLTAVNSTFAGNSATNAGGGIGNGGTLTLTHGTITGNSAADGGGIYSSNTLSLIDSVVSANAAATSADVDGNWGGGNDVIGQAAVLAALGSYGGPTQTVALLPGSPAIAAGGAITTLAADNGSTITVANGAAVAVTSPAAGAGYVIAVGGEQMLVTAVSGNVLTVTRGYNGTTQASHNGGDGVYLGTDQRGIARPADGTTNVGAFESQGFTLSVSAASSPQAAELGLDFVTPLAVTVTANAANEPVAGGVVTYAVPAGGPTATLSSLTATIDGSGQAAVTASAAGSIIGNYTVTATASGAAPVGFDLTNKLPHPALGTLDVTEVTVGRNYSDTIPIARGTGPFAIQTISGLPAGLTAAVSGNSLTISGVAPATPQAINLSVTVVDSEGLTDAKDYLIVVDPVGTFTVTNTSSSSSVVGSLPWALAQANADASVGLVTIDFAAAAGQPFAAPQTIALAGTLNITNTTPGEAIAIEGPASGVTIQGGGSSASFSVFNVASGTTAFLENLTITGGNNFSGAGINTSGTLTVTNTTFANNAGTNGGGIFNNGTLTVTGSTFTGNSATGGSGGGIVNIGTLTVTNSTLTGNSATLGGGIRNISGMTLSQVTLAGNSAVVGPDVYGGAAGANNLIGASDSFLTGISDGVNGNVIGESITLGSLGSYGGLTQTMPLQAGSPGLSTGGAVTTLSATVTSTTATSITVANGGAIAASSPRVGTGYVIQIDSEQMFVTGVSGTTLTVIRGYNGTAAATHTGATENVYLASDQRGLPRPTGSGVSSGAVQGLSYLVTNTGVTPDVVGSLPWAVNQANNDGNHTSITIAFAEGSGQVFAAAQTITLADSLDIANARSGASITVLGPGAGLTLSSAGTNAVVIVGSGTTAELDNLTITGGHNTTTYVGGGVHNDGTLTLSNVIVTGNAASLGGGVHNGGTLTLIDSTVSGNTGDYGGGMNNSGTLVLDNTTIADNVASTFGGGVYNSGTATVTGSSFFLSNTAGYYGGGFYNYYSSASSASITGATFTGNTASQYGGGIYNLHTMTLTDVTLTGNSSDAYGAGICNFGPMTVTGSTIVGNSVPIYGAGIYNHGTLTVSASTVAGNSATLQGGGIYSDSDLTVNGGTLFTGNTAQFGGAISDDQGTATISGATFSGNSAIGGGAVYFWGTLYVAEASFTGNSAAQGGAVYAFGTATITSSSFAGNSASIGGAVIEVDNPMTVAGSTFTGNTATLHGGAISSSGIATVVNSTLAGNSSQLGGAIYTSTNANYRASLTLAADTLVNNSAADGGAVFTDGSTLTAVDVLAAGNSAPAGPDIDGGVVGSNNLIGSGANVHGVTDGSDGNQIGVTPVVSALGSYGGPTQTVALLPGSPALGAGGAITTLTADNGTTVTVASSAVIGRTAPAPGSGYVIEVGGEQMLVTAISGNDLTVTRGYNGTTVTTHNSGDGVFLAADERGVARPAGGAPDVGAFQSRGFTITAAAGASPQAADRNTAFGNPLAVTVTANAAGEPVEGGVVTYTAPVAAASASLSATMATIDHGGHASVNAVANYLPGSYTVDASVAGASAPVGFDLTNNANVAPLTYDASASPTITAYALRYDAGSNLLNLVDADHPATILASSYLPLTSSVDITGHAGGGDTLTLDYSAGYFGVAGGINFHGGGTATLLVTGAGIAGITDTASGPGAGTVTVHPVVGSDSTVAYDGVASVDVAAATATVTLNLPAGVPDAVLQDSGTPGSETIRSAGGAFASLVFIDPTSTLAIYGTGGAAEKLTVQALNPSFNANLVVDLRGNTSVSGTEQIVLDDTAGIAVRTGGNISLSADSIVAANPNNGTAEIATTGKVTLDASSSIGTSANRIQFDATIMPSGIIVGTSVKPAGAYLDGLGSLTLGNVTTRDGALDATARNALTVAAGSTVNTGDGTISLVADAGADTVGNANTGKLTLQSGATVDSTNTSATAITLRGYDIDIATGANPAVVGAHRSLVAAPGSTMTGLYDIYSVAVDASGNRFVAESLPNQVAVFAPGSTSPTGSLTGVSLPTWLALNPSGDLFVVSAFTGTAAEFASGSTTAVPLSGLSSPQFVTCDGQGNLFILNAGNNTVVEYYPGSTAPSLTLTGLNQPNGLALDAGGHVFVSNDGDNTVSEFAPGNTTALATFTGLNHPGRLAVAPNGDLYVSNSDDTISVFAGGSITPTATLTGVRGVTGMLFDAAGNLLVSNFNAGTVSEFAPGSLTPSATLSGMSRPIGMTLDPAGNLYVADYGTATVHEFVQTTTPDAGGVVIRSAQPGNAMSLGGGAADVAGVNLTDAELAQLFTTAGGAVTVGDAGQTGAITFHTASFANAGGVDVQQSPGGAGGVVLDDQGAGSALSAGDVAVQAGAGGISATSTNNAFAEIASTGVVHLDTGGVIGTAARRIQFDPANRPVNVVVGADSQPTSVYLDGLVSAALSTVSVAAASVPPGSTVAVMLRVRDVYGNSETTGGRAVAFHAAGGSFSAVTDNGDGTYTAAYIATGLGQFAIGATVDGQSVTSDLPIVTVLPNYVTTVAGTGAAGYSGDGGQALAARLNNPFGVAVVGNYLFIADSFNNVVREVDRTTGLIITVAGTGSAGYSGDGGQATAAALNTPTSLALSGSDLFIADSGNQVIREVNLTTGVITTIAGSGGVGDTGDGGPATGATFNRPYGVAVAGNELFVADYFNNAVRNVDLTSHTITTIAGGGFGAAGYAGDRGPATSALLSHPFGVATDGVNLFIVDAGNHAIRQVHLATGVITTVAGNGTPGGSGDGGPATSAELKAPYGAAVFGTDLYIADQYNQVIRDVNLMTGIITTLAGTRIAGYSGDGGPSAGATFNFPCGVAVDAAGNLFVADTGNNAIRQLTGPAAPVVTANPASQAVLAGNNATFTAAASGLPTPAVQWLVSADGGASFTPLVDSGVYSGVTTPTLTIVGVDNSLSGFEYEAIFANASGLATTAPATLTLIPTVTAINASVANITDAQTGSGAFTLTVHYSASMNTGVAPGISFSPAVGGSLAFASGSWDAAHTAYTAIYNVADAGASVPAVAVSITGGQSADGNTQVSFSQNGLFAIDTANPAIVSVTPSATAITGAMAGSGTFSLSVTFSAAMDATIAPVIGFTPAVGSTLTLHSGSWDATHTVYTAVYDVANAGVNVPQVAVAVSGARSPDGNAQAPASYSQNNVFAIDTLHPAVVSVTPSAALVTDATVGTQTFSLAVQYSAPMKTTAAPTITFSPAIGTTLTPATSSWNSAHTVFTAVYNVADAGVNVGGVSVAVSGAQSAAGDAQLPFGPAGVFAIDTTNPTVTSITPGASVVNDALTGTRTFQLAVQYSGAMNTAVNPTIAFTPAIASTLTFSAGSWDGTHTLYTASYNVADSAVSVANVAVAVSGGRSAAGNLQVARNLANAFAVDTVNPKVTAVTPSAGLITDVLVGGGTFRLTVAYNAAMSSTTVPTITFNPSVASTLTFASGSWNAARTAYTAVYDVADSGVVNTAGVAVTVTGARNADGNVQVAGTVLGAFKVDTAHPTVTSVTTSTAVVARATTSFSVAVRYGTPMSTAVAPAITFSPAVAGSLTPSATASGWNATGTVYTAVYTVAIANSGGGVSLPSVGVTVSGARNLDRNVQTPFTRASAFGIDTTTPTVVSITPSAAVVADAQRGSGTFTLAVRYSEAMRTTVAPTVAFTPAVASTLSFASGGWDATRTVYTATYNVADASVSIPAVTVAVSGARDAAGNLQAARGVASVFGVDTANPTVTVVTPSAPIVSNTLVGSGTFTLAVQYSAAMNAAVAPSISFSPSVSSTLTFASGSWNAARTVYTASYNVAGSGVSVLNITATVQGAENADGNLQAAKFQSAGFAIDTVTPSVVSVTPSVTTVARAHAGSGTFKLAIQYSAAMSTAAAAAPAIAFSPAVGSTLTFASGSWDATHTVYTATYNVSAAAGVSAPDVAVTVSGAKSGHGNVQAPFTQDQAFAVDTVTPTVTAVTPSAAVVNAALTGGGTFTISVTYSGPMNPSVNPTVAFSRTVSSVLTFASGGWDATGTVYTASYNVAAATASMSGIGVTVSGARNVDGNAQASFTQNSVFDIDTVAPAVVSVTPSVATVTDAQVGAGGFSLSVKFSAAMNTAVNPTINLSPDLGTTLTFVSGSWDATGTVYTATYDVADAGVTVSAVEVTVSDGQSADGNLQTPFDQAGVFGISTV